MMKTFVTFSVALFCVAVVLCCGGMLAYMLGAEIPPKDVSSALVNVSQVGGIVSGFSLTTTAILSLGGDYRKYVLTNHGKEVRTILLVSLLTVVIMSLISSLAPLWNASRCLIFLLGASVALIVASLIVTIILFNGAYSWSQSAKKHELKKSKAPHL